MNLAKRCRVCGDQATGFNYQGLSCDSCKVFFHRTASKSEKLKCHYGGNCSIGVASRKLCPKCRLDKCFQNGMIRRKTSSTSVKANKANKVNSLMSSSFESTLEMSILKSITLFDIHQANESTDTFPKVRKSKHTSLQLNAFEQNLIADIQKAMDVFVDENSVEIVGFINDFMECLDMPSIYIRWTVKFCKKFSAFICLNATDQFLLLKPFCYNILSVRWAFALCPIKNGAPFIINETADQAKWINFNCVNQIQDQKAGNEQIDYYKALNHELENDRTIHDLLCAQMLFSQRNTVSCPEFIRYQNVFYGHLLRRYLQCKYRSLPKANQKLATLMLLIGKLSKIKETEINICKTELRSRNMDIHHLPVLVAEMYDIK